MEHEGEDTGPELPPLPKIAPEPVTPWPSWFSAMLASAAHESPKRPLWRRVLRAPRKEG